MGCARPIQASGRMHRTQSMKLGMKPRSSITCCSPISRTGTTRPVERAMVAQCPVTEIRGDLLGHNIEPLVQRQVILSGPAPFLH